MEQFFEFIGNHWELVAVWTAFVVALLWDNGKKSGETISVNEAINKINKENAVVLDIREHQDYSQGHLVDAMNIPFAKLAERMSELEKHKSRPIVLVCKTGQTVAMAGKMLKQKEFEVYRMQGGMAEWSHQNLPVVKKEKISHKKDKKDKKDKKEQ